MQQEGFKPNEFTFSSCLSARSNLAMLESGQQLHSLVMESGYSDNTYVANALIYMYGKCKCIEDAQAVFKGMALQCTFLWNTIICSYSQNGQGKKALEAFNNMLDEGLCPDEVTFVGVLSACSHMGLIEEGNRHFNSLSNIYGINLTIEHCACMVNILCRAGKFREVERFIKEMRLSQNALIWETVLWACTLHGNVELGERAAKKLFELEPEMDYNYISLSNIFAARGTWDEVEKVRAFMCNQGIKKKPGCSWLNIQDQAHVFYLQDNSRTKVSEVSRQFQSLELASDVEHDLGIRINNLFGNLAREWHFQVKHRCLLRPTAQFGGFVQY